VLHAGSLPATDTVRVRSSEGNVKAILFVMMVVVIHLGVASVAASRHLLRSPVALASQDVPR
jgi:hypothetical protein